jgi:hypothetical protein
MAFHPIVLSGFGRMETDPGDARHLNYVLEHGFQWLAGNPAHRQFWSPPVFYPETNTAAYSETLFGTLPLYAVWRIAGCAPDTSLQWWTLTVSLINFCCAYLFLAKVLRLGTLPGCLGAFLFSFGSSRIVQSGHQQLLPHFFTVGVAAGLVTMFREDFARERWSRRASGLALFFGSLLGQFYACFYLFWMLCLVLLIAGVLALGSRDLRSRLIRLLSGSWREFLIGGALALLAAAPAVIHYRDAARQIGFRTASQAAQMLPSLASWLDQGPYNWVYAGLWRRSGAPQLSFEWEKRLGIGLVTTMLVAYGFMWDRRRSAVRLLWVTTLAVIVLVTVWPADISAWHLVFRVIPGAKAIRAVGRIGLVLLLPACIGLALAFERLSRSRWKVVTYALAAIVILEQGQNMPSYDKEPERRRVEQLARQIPNGCESFYAAFPPTDRPVWQNHLDAMWAGLVVSRPTVNGYSSNLPPGWLPLLDNRVGRAGDEERLRTILARWLSAFGRNPDTNCLVIMPAP